MPSLTLASVLLASCSLVSSLAIAPRVENYYDEVVFIVECEEFWKMSDTTPQTTQDYLWYYQNYDDVVQSTGKKPDDKAYARLPSGHPTTYKHIDWTLATENNKLTATFPNMGNFWVYGLDEEGDSKTSVTGQANLNGNDMRCYTKPRPLVNIKKGDGIEKCKVKYKCTRKGRQIKRTKIEISNEFIEVKMKGMSAMELQSKGLSEDPSLQIKLTAAFDKLQTGKGMDFDTAIDSGFDQYRMTFEVKMAESEGDVQYDATKIPRLTEELKKMVPDIAKGARMGSCGSYYTTYGSDCFWYVPVPKEISLTVQTADQETQNWIGKDFVTVGATNGDCSANAVGSAALAVLFSVGAGLVTGGLSATVAGIGAVVGSAYSVSC